MLDWFKALTTDQIIAIAAIVIPLTVGGIAWLFFRKKADVPNVNFIPFEKHTQILAEKQQEYNTLLIDKTLSERDKEDLINKLSEVTERLNAPRANYQTHIRDLEQRIKEFKAQKGTIPQALLNDAINALKTDDKEKADAIFAEVEHSSQSHIEAAAEAAYQRARIAEDDIEYRTALDHATKATQLNPEESRYLNLTGEISHTLGEYNKAIDYYKQALKLAISTFGEDHPSIALIYDNLGLSLYSQGDPNRALDFYEQALKIKLATFDEGHYSVATTHNNIGGALHAIKKYDDAIGFFEKALKSDLTNFGEHHPDVIRDLNNLGSAWLEKGNNDEAIDCFDQVLIYSLATVGGNHPRVATIYNNLGVAWAGKDEYDKAVVFCEQAVKIDLKIFGKNHPDVSRDLYNLGAAWKGKGEYGKAIDFYTQAFTIARTTLGNNHPTTRTIKHELS